MADPIASSRSSREVPTRACGLPYFIAVVSIVVAVAVRWFSEQFLEGSFPYFTAFIAVAFVSWYASLGPALLATVLGFLLSNWLFVPPEHALTLYTAKHWFGTAGYFAVCLSIAGFGEARRRAHQRIQHSLAERWQAEETLRAREADYRSLFNATMDAVFVMSADGKCIDVNAAASELIARARKDIIGMYFPRLVDQPQQTLTEEALRGLKQTGSWQSELPMRRSDGTAVWTEFRTRAEGELILAVGRDITERRAAEQRIQILNQELQQQVYEFQALIETLPVGIGLTTDAGCEHIRANFEFARMLGIESRENLSKSAPQAGRLPFKVLRNGREVSPEELPMQRACQTGGQIIDDELTIVRADGTVVHELCRATPLRDRHANVRGCIGVFLDITKRKLAEDALRESEERFRNMADNAPVMIWLTSPDGNGVYLNKVWYDFTGQPKEGSLGYGWLDLVHPEDREETKRIFNTSNQRHDTYRTEFRLRRGDGEYRWVIDSAAPRFDAEGRFLGYIGSVLDITERKAAEDLLQSQASRLETLVTERTARLSETLGELEAFSYSIAHDMRAPLRSMQGFSKILLSEYAPSLDDEGRDYLQRISGSSERLDRLITDILNYSKVVRNELALEPIQVEPLIREIVVTYAHLQPSAANIEIQGLIPPVLANPAAMTQVISNLLGNAVKFVNPGVPPQVRIWSEVHGAWVRIWFADNGIGIPEEAHHRIFQMFQRLNQQNLYEGTGMGLAIVRKAVDRMGGMVGVESEVGKGSRFWVELKKAERGGS